MSWDSYIDNMVAQSKDVNGLVHCDKACIIGMDGASWTSQGHANAIKIQGPEAQLIGKQFKSNTFDAFMTGGVRIENVKYQFLRVEDGKCVYAKKKGAGAISMQKSKTAVVIGHCPEGSQQGNTNKAVGIIADYLESLGM